MVGASLTPVTAAVRVSAFAAHEPVVVRLPRFFRSAAVVLVVSVWLLSATLTVSEPGVPWKLAAGTKCNCALAEIRMAAVSLNTVVVVGGIAIQVDPLFSENSHVPCPTTA